MKTKYLILSIIILISFILCYVLFIIFHFTAWEKRGLFGDSFGALNALFSVFAFLGLIYTILLQRSELSLQREELKLQREEMAASREQLEAQVKAQNNLCNVLVGLIKVASIQAMIEKTKIAAESKVPGAREEFQQEIINLSEDIKNIAEELKIQD